MKHTFKSWLIANMEPIVLAIVVPLVLLLFIITENEFILEYFFVILSLSSAPTNDGSSTGLTWFTIALCLCVGGLYFVGGGLWCFESYRSYLYSIFCVKSYRRGVVASFFLS